MTIEEDAAEHVYVRASQPRIAELCFSRTFTTPGQVETRLWADIREANALDFTAELSAGVAVTTVLEFTNAPDPNVTPPASPYIVSATDPLPFAGTSLGGIEDIRTSIPRSLDWVRLVITCVSAGTITIHTAALTQPPTPAQLPIAAVIKRGFRASIVQSIERAERPNGDIVTAKAAGPVSAQSSTANLAGGGVFAPSTVTPSLGWDGLRVNVKSNVNSAVDGLKVYWYADAAGTALVDTSYRTYAAAPDGRTYFLQPLSDYFKVEYTNGASAQSSFRLDVSLIREIEETGIPLGDAPDDGHIAHVTIARLTAPKDGSGDYANQTATAAGNPKFAIAEHSVDTPIKTGATWKPRSRDATTSANSIAAAFSDRGTIAVVASVHNTEDCYLAASETDLAAADDRILIHPGMTIEIDVNESATIWFKSVSGTQRLGFIEVKSK